MVMAARQTEWVDPVGDSVETMMFHVRVPVDLMAEFREACEQLHLTASACVRLFMALSTGKQVPLERIVNRPKSGN